MSLNLLESVTYYDVNLFNVDVDLSSKIKQMFSMRPEEMTVRLAMSTINSMDIPTDAVDWDSCEFDEDELEILLTESVGNHPHYLVIACGCRWNGASGYMFTDEIVKTCARNYDISLTLEEEGKNAIMCRESSHDVPMGGKTYIVGLSEEEYEDLEDAELERLIEVAESRF